MEKDNVGGRPSVDYDINAILVETVRRQGDTEEEEEAENDDDDDDDDVMSEVINQSYDGNGGSKQGGGGDGNDGNDSSDNCSNDISVFSIDDAGLEEVLMTLLPPFSSSITSIDKQQQQQQGHHHHHSTTGATTAAVAAHAAGGSLAITAGSSSLPIVQTKTTTSSAVPINDMTEMLNNEELKMQLSLLKRQVAKLEVENNELKVQQKESQEVLAVTKEELRSMSLCSSGFENAENRFKVTSIEHNKAVDDFIKKDVLQMSEIVNWKTRCDNEMAAKKELEAVLEDSYEKLKVLARASDASNKVCIY